MRGRSVVSDDPTSVVMPSPATVVCAPQVSSHVERSAEVELSDAEASPVADAPVATPTQRTDVRTESAVTDDARLSAPMLRRSGRISRPPERLDL